MNTIREEVTRDRGARMGYRYWYGAQSLGSADCHMGRDAAPSYAYIRGPRDSGAPTRIEAPSWVDLKAAVMAVMEQRAACFGFVHRYPEPETLAPAASPGVERARRYRAKALEGIGDSLTAPRAGDDDAMNPGN